MLSIINALSCFLAIDCGSLIDPLNGIVEVTGTSAGDTATYRCNNGFVLFGKGIRECHDDGTWNGKAPECRGTYVNKKDLSMVEAYVGHGVKECSCFPT